MYIISFEYQNMIFYREEMQMQKKFYSLKNILKFDKSCAQNNVWIVVDFFKGLDLNWNLCRFWSSI